MIKNVTKFFYCKTLNLMLENESKGIKKNIKYYDKFNNKIKTRWVN